MLVTRECREGNSLLWVASIGADIRCGYSTKEEDVDQTIINKENEQTINTGAVLHARIVKLCYARRETRLSSEIRDF
jgi:hypothetical protein